MTTNGGFIPDNERKGEDRRDIPMSPPPAAPHEILPINIDDVDDKVSTKNNKNWLSRTVSQQCNLPNHAVTQLVNYALIIVLAWTLLYLLLNQEVLVKGGLFKLLLLVGLAYVAGYLFSLIKLPALLGMLLIGVAMKTSGFFYISGVYPQIVVISRNIALTVILIKAGLGLDPAALFRLKVTVLKLSILPCLGEALAAGGFCYLIMGFPLTWSFLLGFLLSPISPAVVVPTLLNLKERGYGEDKGIATLVIAASSLDDILSISVFGVLLSLIFSSGSLTMELIRGPLEVVVGVVAGILWGFVCAGFPHRSDGLVVVKRSAMIGLGGVVFVLGSIQLNFPGAGPLACITAAFVANLSWKLQGWDTGKPSPVANVFSTLWLIVQPILFGLIGSEIDLFSLEAHSVGYGIGIVLAALVCRSVVCVLSLLGGSLSIKEMIFVNLAWLPKATVQAALSPQPLDYLNNRHSTDEYSYEIARFILTTAVLAILITAPIGSIAITISGPRLLEKSPLRSPSIN